MRKVDSIVLIRFQKETTPEKANQILNKFPIVSETIPGFEI